MRFAALDPSLLLLQSSSFALIADLSQHRAQFERYVSPNQEPRSRHQYTHSLRLGLAALARKDSGLFPRSKPLTNVGTETATGQG